MRRISARSVTLPPLPTSGIVDVEVWPGSEIREPDSEFRNLGLGPLGWGSGGTGGVIGGENGGVDGLKLRIM
jgi:hypothetical protein